MPLKIRFGCMSDVPSHATTCIMQLPSLWSSICQGIQAITTWAVSLTEVILLKYMVTSLAVLGQALEANRNL